MWQLKRSGNFRDEDDKMSTYFVKIEGPFMRKVNNYITKRLVLR